MKFTCCCCRYFCLQPLLLLPSTLFHKAGFTNAHSSTTRSMMIAPLSLRCRGSLPSSPSASVRITSFTRRAVDESRRATTSLITITAHVRKTHDDNVKCQLNSRGTAERKTTTTITTTAENDITRNATGRLCCCPLRYATTAAAPSVPNHCANMLFFLDICLCIVRETTLYEYLCTYVRIYV